MWWLLRRFLYAAKQVERRIVSRPVLGQFWASLTLIGWLVSSCITPINDFVPIKHNWKPRSRIAHLKISLKTWSINIFALYNIWCKISVKTGGSFINLIVAEFNVNYSVAALLYFLWLGTLKNENIDEN